MGREVKYYVLEGKLYLYFYVKQGQQLRSFIENTKSALIKCVILIKSVSNPLF